MDFAQRITEKYIVSVRVLRSRRRPMLAYTVQATLRNWEGLTLKELVKLKQYIWRSGFADACGTNFFFFVCIRGTHFVDDIWLDRNTLESVADRILEILET